MVKTLQRVLQHRSLPSASVHLLMHSLSYNGCSRDLPALLKSVDCMLLSANVPLANEALRACCRTGDAVAALEMYRSLRDRGVTPESASFDAVLLVTSGQEAHACAEVLLRSLSAVL